LMITARIFAFEEKGQSDVVGARKAIKVPSSGSLIKFFYCSSRNSPPFLRAPRSSSCGSNERFKVSGREAGGRHSIFWPVHLSAAQRRRGNDQKENSPGKRLSLCSRGEGGKTKLSARMNDFNLMFNGFLFIFLITSKVDVFLSSPRLAAPPNSSLDPSARGK
jgi:hypothetical protein